jgi:organic hydroperoxide reductase OsmC/OhrA
VPECDQATFQQAAEDADAGCPISALIKGTATVTVEAVLDEGGV